ncbi:MAG: hypothetical protein RL095_1573 [Verrucomicrobiota bacterium]|jgi:signal transduction histidine kinase/CheY-like chemotaxis protein/CheY-specific phosphatase CheX
MNPPDSTPHCLSHSRLLEIFDAAADAILVIDNHGRILAANAAAKAMAETDPVGQTEGAILELAASRQGCDAWYGPRRIPVDINITSESAGTMVCLARDVRSRLESEAQSRARAVAEEANRAKGMLLANMSHEIRTPLNGILSMAKILATADAGEEQRTGLEIIRSSGESLLRIVDDILDYSKIEAGKLSLELVEINFRELLDDIVSLYALNAQRKNIELHSLVSPMLPRKIRGDPLRLRQLIGNLLSNAIKFTAAGEVVLTVRPGSRPDEIGFEIRDSGIGISAEALQRLFQPFEQADGSTTRRFGGTGLGLSICKSLVELMDGRIRVASEPGKGSCFSFEIKLPAAEDGEPSPGDSLRIHLDGGGESVRHSCAYLLQSAGHEVVTAPGKAQVLINLNAHLPDPDELRKQHPGLRLITQIPLSRFLAGDKESRPSGWDGITPSPLTARLLQILAPPAARKSPCATAGGAALRILIADDNAVNQKILVRILERLGHQTCVCNDGAEAVLACEASEFDLILMDCMMPNLDGLQATRVLRERGSKLRIVAITANAIKGERENCLKAGMDEYLTKPVNFAELTRILNQCRLAPREDAAEESATPLMDAAQYEAVLDSLSRGLDEMFGDGARVERQVSRAQPWPSFRESLMACIRFDTPTLSGQIILGCDHATASKMLEPLLPGVELDDELLSSGIGELLNAVSCSLSGSQSDPGFRELRVGPPRSWRRGEPPPPLKLSPGQESVLKTRAGTLLLFICFSEAP